MIHDLSGTFNSEMPSPRQNRKTPRPLSIISENSGDDLDALDHLPPSQPAAILDSLSSHPNSVLTSGSPQRPRRQRPGRRMAVAPLEHPMLELSRRNYLVKGNGISTTPGVSIGASNEPNFSKSIDFSDSPLNRRDKHSDSIGSLTSESNPFNCQCQRNQSLDSKESNPSSQNHNGVLNKPSNLLATTNRDVHLLQLPSSSIHQCRDIKTGQEGFLNKENRAKMFHALTTSDALVDGNRSSKSQHGIDVNPLQIPSPSIHQGPDIKTGQEGFLNNENKNFHSLTTSDALVGGNRSSTSQHGIDINLLHIPSSSIHQGPDIKTGQEGFLNKENSVKTLHSLTTSDALVDSSNRSSTSQHGIDVIGNNQTVSNIQYNENNKEGLETTVQNHESHVTNTFASSRPDKGEGVSLDRAQLAWRNRVSTSFSLRLADKSDKYRLPRRSLSSCDSKKSSALLDVFKRTSGHRGARNDKRDTSLSCERLLGWLHQPMINKSTSQNRSTTETLPTSIRKRFWQGNSETRQSQDLGVASRNNQYLLDPSKHKFLSRVDASNFIHTRTEKTSIRKCSLQGNIETHQSQDLRVASRNNQFLVDPSKHKFLSRVDASNFIHAQTETSGNILSLLESPTNACNVNIRIENEILSDTSDSSNQILDEVQAKGSSTGLQVKIPIPIRRISAIDQSDLTLLKATTSALNLSTRRASVMAWRDKYLDNQVFLKRQHRSQEPLDKGPASSVKDFPLTNENKDKINQSLSWLRQELINIRIQDQSLARQFLAIRHTMNQLRLALECEGHQDLLDSAEEDMEELRELSRLADIPTQLLLPVSSLQHIGVTRLNLASRRFSAC